MRIGQPTINYAPEAPAAGAAAPAAGAVPPPAAGAAAAVAPWGTDPNTMWMVDNKPWYETYVPDGPARALAADKKYNNPVAQSEAYYALNKQFSGDTRIQVPGADADAKTMNEYYAKRGRPDAADKYDLKFDPAVKVDPKFVQFGKEVAFDLGLTPKEAQTLGDKWNKFIGGINAEGSTAQAAANDTAIGELKTQLGDQGFDAAMAAGNRVMTALKNNKTALAAKGVVFTDADFANIEANIGAGPIAKLLIGVGLLSGEAPFVNNGGGNAPAGSPEAMSQTEAAAEITRLNGDADFQKKFTTAADPGHKDAVDRMARLYARAGNTAPV